ncbi:flavin reductase [Clostridium sp. 19966]|uniref:flavin reductase family protein n=1 Tax=Clostridium sp. 19966 TaxID=2768166 RepID=UPI0028DEF5D2|nr:flavin reductase [Clostridium sp. 19966]MDT8717158.1 flavin reductase [Clostridium sp. 19966]
MKREFTNKPANIKEEWPGELEAFSWQDFITAIPSPIFVVTTYKDNGKENACLQSWSTFVGSQGEFICVLGSVSKYGHLYKSLLQKKECVLNFPSSDIYKKCEETIENNAYEDDEITMSGLTAEKAVAVNAPRIKECFLNIECQLLWEKEHFQGSDSVVIALKAKHICMDSEFYDESKKGRYGKTGYIYNIHDPQNPDTGEAFGTCLGALEKYNI